MLDSFFSGWLDSDSCDNPGDSAPTQPKFQICQPDSTLTQLIWIRVESTLIHGWSHFTLFGKKLLSRFFFCKATYKCKVLTFSLQKNQWLNFDSSSIQFSQLWLKWSAGFVSDSFTSLNIFTLTRLIWVRIESNLTHDSRVEHNPALQGWALAGVSVPFCCGFNTERFLRRRPRRGVGDKLPGPKPGF